MPSAAESGTGGSHPPARCCALSIEVARAAVAAPNGDRTPGSVDGDLWPLGGAARRRDRELRFPRTPGRPHRALDQSRSCFRVPPHRDRVAFGVDGDLRLVVATRRREVDPPAPRSARQPSRALDHGRRSARRAGPHRHEMTGAVDGDLRPFGVRARRRQVERRAPSTGGHRHALDDVVRAIRPRPDGDGVAGRVDRKLRRLGALARRRDLQRCTPGTARRPLRSLDYVVGAVQVTPDHHSVAGGVDGDLRFRRVLAGRRDVDRRQPGGLSSTRRRRPCAQEQQDGGQHERLTAGSWRERSTAHPRTLHVRVRVDERTRPSAKLSEAKTKGKETRRRSRGAGQGAER